MTEQKATNVHWHEGEVTREDRNQLLKQKAQPYGLLVFPVAVKVRLPLLWNRR